MFMDFKEDAHNDGKNTKNSKVNVDLIIEMDVAQNPKILVQQLLIRKVNTGIGNRC